MSGKREDRADEEQLLETSPRVRGFLRRRSPESAPLLSTAFQCFTQKLQARGGRGPGGKSVTKEAFQ